LIAVSCFSVGTNQIVLDAACQPGIPAFNAPFSITRSVAELVIGEIIHVVSACRATLRRFGHDANAAHKKVRQ